MTRNAKSLKAYALNLGMNPLLVKIAFNYSRSHALETTKVDFRSIPTLMLYPESATSAQWMLLSSSSQHFETSQLSESAQVCQALDNYCP